MQPLLLLYMMLKVNKQVTQLFLFIINTNLDYTKKLSCNFICC